MEHLPFPQNSGKLETVRYVCSKPYDGGSFLEYPLRENKPQGMPSAEEGPASLSFLRYEQLHPTPNNELEDFFQTWLFFGLIHEFMGEFCNRETFLRRFEDGKAVLSTSALPDIVSQWVALIKSGSSSLSYDHVAQCLHRVLKTLRAAGPAFDPNIKFSIASVGELLEFAANEAFDTKDLTVDNKCPASWRGMIEDKYWLGPMQQSGWCPSQIKVTLDASGSLQVQQHFNIFQHLQLHNPC